ncbi:hypothetical protein OF377_02700 [Ureaplasma sp. ES3154-GEN]|uniref:hypothetical protein n=1 Tax=Ureaplasma sp. ES3154-GEN TaxID=2984844 RepID=UPI0021E74088|nr:hypothetical protein [Ureaplasma sp. ES3154-GEN]MCV3743772.1 hypothetical protein [Ureaplasma sp. ES3154-GEN]
MSNPLWTRNKNKLICNNCFYQIDILDENYEDLMFTHNKHCADDENACADSNA